MKKHIDNDIVKCCAFCEKAMYTDDEDVMFCVKRKSDVNAGECCRAFSYDLLKRKPSSVSSPPTLDPSLLQF